MKESTDIENQELDELFEKYRQAPDSYVFVVLADACRKIGRVEEAMDICDSGVAKHPTYASGHVVKGKCLYDLKRHDEARESFKEVLALDANNLVALKFLGKLEADMGRYDEAREYFQNILALDPDNVEIKKTLQDVDEQEEMARSSSPGKEAQPGATGAAHVANGAESIETSEELATITLADIFANQGYKDKAIKIYQEVLRKQPDNAVVYEKLRELGGDPVVKAEPPDARPAEPDSAGGDVDHVIIDTGAPGVEHGRGTVDDMRGVEEVSTPGGSVMEPEKHSDGEPAHVQGEEGQSKSPEMDETPGVLVEPPSIDDALGVSVDPPVMDDVVGVVVDPPVTDDVPGAAVDPPVVDEAVGVTLDPPVTDDAPGVVVDLPVTDDAPGVAVDPPVTDDAAVDTATKSPVDTPSEPPPTPSVESTVSGDAGESTETTVHTEEPRTAETEKDPEVRDSDGHKGERKGARDEQHDVPPLVIRLGMEEGAAKRKTAAKGKKKQQSDDDIPDSLDTRRSRRQIDEKESLSHFKRWLNRLND